jgi:hypothetical protein
MVIVVTENFFMRGQPNRKLRDRQLGPFTCEEHIGKHIYSLKLLATHCLHQVFHVNNMGPCSTTCLRLVVPMATPQSDDDEFKVSHIFVVCIKSLHGRRGGDLLFITHFSDDDVSHVWHRLNEVHRTTTLHDFPEMPEWLAFSRTHTHIDFMHAHPMRILESPLLLQ